MMLSCGRAARTALACQGIADRVSLLPLERERGRRAPPKGAAARGSTNQDAGRLGGQQQATVPGRGAKGETSTAEDFLGEGASLILIGKSAARARGPAAHPFGSLAARRDRAHGFAPPPCSEFAVSRMKTRCGMHRCRDPRSGCWGGQIAERNSFEIPVFILVVTPGPYPNVNTDSTRKLIMATTRLLLSTLAVLILAFPLRAQEKPKSDKAEANSTTKRIEKKHYEFKDAGKEIEYALFVPSTYDKAKKTPLIVALHGLGSNPQQILRYSGFTDLAEKHGYIIVAPMGYNERGWYGQLSRVGGRGDDPKNLPEL